jgi:hypothetical protein
MVEHWVDSKTRRKTGFVPMVVWKGIEFLPKCVSLRTPPGGNPACQDEDRLRAFSVAIRTEKAMRRWKAAVRFRLKEGAGFCEIERRIGNSPLGSPLLLLPKGVARFC